MVVEAKHIKDNFLDYLKLSEDEDIMITENNKIIATLSNPDRDKVEKFKALRGILKNSRYTLEDVIDERISNI